MYISFNTVSPLDEMSVHFKTILIMNYDFRNLIFQFFKLSYKILTEVWFSLRLKQLKIKVTTPIRTFIFFSKIIPVTQDVQLW